MNRQKYYDETGAGETTFTVSASNIKFGAGCLRELGPDASLLGMKRVAFFVDANVLETEPARVALESLNGANVDAVIYEDAHVEPTDTSFREATDFARDGEFDGFISLGGGSVMDTAKAANLFATYPDDLLAYVNAPIGQAKPVPGPVKPHIACPTTSGTGSETTGVTIFDFVERNVKTGISSKWLKPTMAVVDPTTTESLPGGIVAATGFDVFTHAIESYTAVPFTGRDRPASPDLRPPYQGANPYSDIGSMHAIRLGGRYLIRAVNDASDHEARHALMFASTLAGLSFGNAGVHIPHAMSYAAPGSPSAMPGCTSRTPCPTRWRASTIPSVPRDTTRPTRWCLTASRLLSTRPPRSGSPPRRRRSATWTWRRRWAPIQPARLLTMPVMCSPSA